MWICTSFYASQNAFPGGSLYSVHILALDALLAVVQSIEEHCHTQLMNSIEKAPKEGATGEAGKKTKEKTGMRYYHRLRN